MKELPEKDLTINVLKEFIEQANKLNDMLITFNHNPSLHSQSYDLLVVHNKYRYAGCYINIFIKGDWKDSKIRTRNTDISLVIHDRVVMTRKNFNEEELVDFLNKTFILVEELHDKY